MRQILLYGTEPERSLGGPRDDKLAVMTQAGVCHSEWSLGRNEESCIHGTAMFSLLCLPSHTISFATLSPAVNYPVKDVDKGRAYPLSEE